MKIGDMLNRWLDIRPDEGKRLLILTSGAFLLLSFVVASRSLREARGRGLAPAAR